MKNRLAILIAVVLTACALAAEPNSLPSKLQTVQAEQKLEDPVSQSMESETMDRALAAFRARDYEKAASEIRRCAKMLESESRQASGVAQQDILESVHRLESLSDLIEAGEVESETHLKWAFADAHTALAKYHLAEAERFGAEGQFEETSENLKAAADEFEQAMKRIGRRLETAGEFAIDDARELARELTKDAKEAAERLSRTLNDLSKELEKTSDEIDEQEEKK